jgi:hypothetical protein
MIQTGKLLIDKRIALISAIIRSAVPTIINSRLICIKPLAANWKHFPNYGIIARLF